MLPDVSDDELLDALGAVVTAGWQLPERVEVRTRVAALLYLAETDPEEPYATTAKRILMLIDKSLLEQQEALAQDEGSQWEQIEVLDGLRILLGVHPRYRTEYATANSRRWEAAPLIIPAHIPPGQPSMKPDTFYRTWERRALQIVLDCLRKTYGQEKALPRQDFQTIARRAICEVGGQRRFAQVDSVHTWRVMVDHLDQVWTRVYRIEKGAQVAFEPLEGVGEPQITQYRRHHYLMFPLLQPASLGEEVRWAYRRKYAYASNLSPRYSDRMALTGNRPGFTVGAEVRFHQEVPPEIWSFGVHSLDVPGSPTAENLLAVDDQGMVRFPQRDKTVPSNAYGIAWRWEPERFR